MRLIKALVTMFIILLITCLSTEPINNVLLFCCLTTYCYNALTQRVFLPILTAYSGKQNYANIYLTTCLSTDRVGNLNSFNTDVLNFVVDTNAV